MLNNYFKTIFRNLVRNGSYSAINIVGLSLGLACAMLIILYTKDELTFDRFHNDVSRIYRITNTRVRPDGSIENQGGNTGTFQGPRFTANVPGLQSYVRFTDSRMELKQGSDIAVKQIMVADSNFLSMFTFPLLSGNPSTALNSPNAVVISETMAKEQFGTANALGKTMLFKSGDQFEPYIVTAVVQDPPQNSSIRFDILMPLKIEAGNENWGNIYLSTFVTVAPGLNIPQAEAKIKKFYEADARDEIKKWAEKYDEKNTVVYGLQPFTDIHLSEKYNVSNGMSKGSNPMYSYILSGIALFILLIACINFVNLTVARSVKRAKEIGIRKVIGGSRKQLITQFMGESFALCLFAFLFALLIVEFMLPTFNQLSNKALYFSYLLDVKLVAGYACLLVVTGLLAGFYPAMVLSGYNPVQTLYSRFSLGGKSYLQKGLVVFQFALATLLVICTITIYSQFNYLTKASLGYDDKDVVIVENRGMKIEAANVFKAELLKSPNVLSVAFKNGGRQGTSAKVNGGIEIGFDYEVVDPAYLPLLKIQMASGRNFSSDFPSDTANSVLVNETFVKTAGWKKPIGQIVDFWYNPGEKYTVVGVVKDYHFRPLAENMPAQLFKVKPPGGGYGLAFVKIKPNSASASLQHIEKTFKALFPLNSFSYKFKELENLKNYEAEAKWKQMMLFGAIVTIFISAIGLFGLSVLSAEKRTKEIGIRKVLGASVSGVVSALSADFLKLVTLAMLIAMPVAWILANKWLQNYPNRIDLSWWIFASAGLLILFISMLTVSFYSVKAAMANPIKSLRTE